MTENRENVNNAAAVDGGVNKTLAGNAAVMREAVEKVIEILNREWDAHRETSAMWEIQEICTAALAAPARNCERFGSCAEAKAEWWKTEVLPRVYGVVSGAEPPFADWLFAKVTEKGDNDGK